MEDFFSNERSFVKFGCSKSSDDVVNVLFLSHFFFPPITLYLQNSYSGNGAASNLFAIASTVRCPWENGFPPPPEKNAFFVDALRYMLRQIR